MTFLIEGRRIANDGQPGVVGDVESLVRIGRPRVGAVVAAEEVTEAGREERPVDVVEEGDPFGPAQDRVQVAAAVGERPVLGAARPVEAHVEHAELDLAQVIEVYLGEGTAG